MNKILVMLLGLSLVTLPQLSRAADAAASHPLAIGATAPDFTLPDQNGKSVKLSDLRGHYVVVQWTNSECPFVKRHYKLNTTNNLVSKWAPKGVVFLAIDSSNFVTEASIKETVKEKKVNYQILDDSSGAVGREYGAKSTPHVFIIDKDGKVIYQGAMDNDPYGDKVGKDRVNYIEQALSEVSTGKPVSVATSQPYGCGVKYKEEA